MSDSAPSIAPTGLGGKGKPFILSTAEWISIQVYVKEALALPITDKQMRAQLGMPATEPIQRFLPIITAYNTINGHCSTWQNQTFPSTVNLADDIVHYNVNVPVYYGALNELLPPFGQSMTGEAKAQFTAIVDLLSKQAATFAQNAEDVEKAITTFSQETTKDQETISKLVVQFNKEYGTSSSEVVELRKELKAQRMILRSENSAYNHDVIVASTSPTYAWVLPPAGLIAAAIVAGVYGHKAVEALHAENEARKKIKQYKGEVQRDVTLMDTITSAESGLKTILSDITKALVAVQQIKGIWQAIASDLTNIGKTIETDIEKALTIIKNFGITAAIDAWADVATEANDYRVNAYVTPQSTAYCVAHKAEYEAMIQKANAATKAVGA